MTENEEILDSLNNDSMNSSTMDKSSTNFLEDRIDSQATVIAIMKQRNDHLIINNKNYEEKIDKLENELKFVGNERERLSKENMKQKNEFLLLSQNHELLLDLLSNQKTDKETLENGKKLMETNESLEKLIEEMKQQNLTLNEKLKSIETDFSISKTELNDKIERLSLLEKHSNSMEDIIKNNEKVLLQLQQCYDRELTMKSQIEKEFQELKKNMNNSNEEVSMLKKNVIEKSEEIKLLKKDKENLLVELKRKKEENSQKTYSSNFTKLQLENESLQERISTLNREFEIFRKHMQNEVRKERQLSQKLSQLTT
ncbi:hypothetical protein SNEBB_007190 [Seison nebaliae]|nr:hypothetical protein SNEBB_007190 [Seison nebaliae]